MNAFDAYCRMIAHLVRRGDDPRWWRHTLDWLWQQLSDDERERAPVISFPTD